MKSLGLKVKTVKASLVIFLVLFMILSGNMSAKEKKWEVSLTGYGLFSDGFMPFPGGMISFGHTESKGFGYELGTLISLYGGVIFMGNIVATPFDLNPVAPYLLVGIGTFTFGGFLINTSAGIRMKLASKKALRIEYQRWFIEPEESIGLVRAGVSFYF
ncbi:MAG: hypothetical protein R6V00_12435 [Candidatus Aminicenantes bacterium]